MTRIGFIGLGNMGGPMSTNLVAAGHQVKGFDVTAEAVAAAAEAGVSRADSPADAAADADVVVTMLPRGEIVRTALLGPDGALGALAPGALLIDCSSIDVSTTRELHELAAAAGIAYLDAPVSGGVGGARAGTLTFMVGGEADAVERGRAVFDAMGAKVVHAGAPGAGQAVKSLNQLVFGTTLAVVAEAFTLADKLDVDPSVLYDVVTSASGDCWAIRNFCPWPGVVAGSAADSGYEPRFSARLMSKDLGLALDAAASVGQEVSVGSVAAALYAQLAARPEDIDSSAVIQALPGAPVLT